MCDYIVWKNEIYKMKVKKLEGEDTKHEK